MNVNALLLYENGEKTSGIAEQEGVPKTKVRTSKSGWKPLKKLV